MKKIILLLSLLVMVMSGCAAPKPHPSHVAEQINKELNNAVAQRTKPAPPAEVNQALLPPLVVELPKQNKIVEPRFDLVVNGAPANQVFTAIVSGTRYSMLVSPDIKDPVTVNLKDVTVFEALDTLRELYGYEYTVQGTRIFIQPMTLQTHVFQVNYLLAKRQGRTDVRVTSGSVSDSGSSGSGSSSSGSSSSNSTSGGVSSSALESSRVTTSSENDFWADLATSLKAIVGGDAGRQVVVNSQSGVIVVRAFPREMRSVRAFLQATQLVVERQVMLEAKIIEVSLNDTFQAGINWAAFNTSNNSRFALGQVTPGTTLSPSGSLTTYTARAADGSLLASSALTSNPSAPGSLAAGTGVLGGLFGLAFQTGSFAALLNFLETQGVVHVLSSPRIATLNNQKAVLKVGTDEFFVTNVTTTNSSTGTTSTVSPSITVQPFFSGIALDVMPQIDDGNNIILHIHPSVSQVAEKSKDINLGSLGVFTLPLASSNINETDSVVRVQDGNIVAIGGLMKQRQTNDSSQVPGAGDLPVVGNLFKQNSRASVKSELVILIKPTVIRSDRNWQQDLVDAQQRIQALDQRNARSTD